MDLLLQPTPLRCKRPFEHVETDSFDCFLVLLVGIWRSFVQGTSLGSFSHFFGMAMMAMAAGV